MLVVLPAAGLFFLALVVGLGFVIRDTVRRKGNWGINLKPVTCPCCGEPAPMVRAPKNLRQVMWGGMTCDNCGLEYDKWGNAVVPTRPTNTHLADDFDLHPYEKHDGTAAEDS